MSIETSESDPSSRVTDLDKHAAYLDTAHGVIDRLDEDYLRIAVVLLVNLLKSQYPDAAEAMDAKKALREDP